MARWSPPPSPRFEALAAGAAFRDTIAVPADAPPEALFRAFRAVTLAEMPIARVLGGLRYLPARLMGRKPPGDAARPFLDILGDTGTLILVDDAPREIVTGSAGQYHRLGDQLPVRFASREAFDAFDDPRCEKLFMSVRVVPTVAGGWILVLEHATRALSAAAARRFRWYWWVIRPAGALVSRLLLQAIVRRAKRLERERG